jgi:outer membrane receptor protein involved in Fe transport
VVFEQGLGGNVRATSSIYLKCINGLIGQSVDEGDGLNFFGNLQQVEMRGLEAELEGSWNRGLRGRLSYTYADARDTTTSAVLDNSPRHLGKASALTPLWGKRIFAVLELQAMSSRGTVQGSRERAYWTANATLYSRELVNGLELSASVYNLFSRHYSDPVPSDYV